MALRNFRRHILTSFINLSGLTIGLTCCLLILIYVLHERSYDRYNKNADRTYRVTRIFYGANGHIDIHLAAIAPPFGPLLKNDFPDIEAVTQILPFGDSPVPLRYKEKRFNEKAGFFADENISKIFDIQMIEGADPSVSLKDPFCVLISDEEAKKYFGGDDPLNKVIRYNNMVGLKVTGVYKSFPDNAHLHPGMLFSFSTLRDSAIYGEQNLRTNYGNNAFLTYLLMPKGYPMDKLTAQFPAFLDQHLGPNQDGSKASTGTALEIQKLTDIHLKSHLADEADSDNGDATRVTIFGAIALFILLIACINYMNLATARASLRAREIGIRKTIGAARDELIFQFLSESVLMAYLGMALAVGLCALLLPYMSQLSGRNLTMAILGAWKIWVPLTLLPLLVGSLSGIYPALVLSGFKPVKVLKGILKAETSDISLRKLLVVLQFSISIALIICTWIVYQQVRYMLNKPLGYDKNYLVVLPYQSELDKTYDAFRNDLLSDPRIRNLARSSRIPTGRLLDQQGVAVMENGKLLPININLKFVSVDHDFVPTFDIPMDKGRNFSREFQTDTGSFVINEAAVKDFGWKTADQAIGKEMNYGGQEGHVIGVMHDIYFEDLKEEITPLLLYYPGLKMNPYYGKVTIRISGSDVQGALAHIEQTWKEFLPEKAFEYSFLDQNFDKLYEGEIRQGHIFTLFSGIAIFIACMGLLGLSAFTISQRVKEIGIRKVLGASTTSIVSLISTDFLKLVLVAALFAFGAAWYAMYRWLEGFAYRIPVHWWVFLCSGFIAVLIAFATISVLTIKAASANPVKNLRTE